MKTTDVAQMQMNIADIEIGSNYRSHMDPTKLKELTENIRDFGVLQPVLIRKGEKERYILIAGHRRLAAAKSAGYKQIPARVLQVGEKQADEIQALENLHREDLSPLDEARAFKHLLDLGQHTHQTLAAQVDKSVQYIYRSLRLLDLPEKALQALAEGILTTGHAHQILRAPQKNIDALVEFATTKLGWQKRYPTVDELKQHIEKTIEKDLASAPFPKDKPFGGEIACTGCPFNTGNQGALFDGASKGHCTNPGCFNKKTGAYYKELQAVGAKRFPGLAYIGASSSDRMYGDRQIKGAFVVDTLTGKMRKAMKDDPGQFGYGILKQSKWGQDKKPQLVLLCKDAKLAGVQTEKPAPVYRELTPEERERDTFVHHHIDKGYMALILDKVDFNKADLLQMIEAVWEDEWQRDHMTPLLQAAGVSAEMLEGSKFPEEFFEEKSREALIQLAFLLGAVARFKWQDLLERRKIDVETFVKKADAEARKHWEEAHRKAA